MKKRVLTFGLCLLLSGTVFGQNYTFKPLKQTKIDGAPTLSAPHFVMNDKGKPITVAKLGLAGPTIYDWDGDGVKDLLVGEFGSGIRANLMIFKNNGTDEKPVYSSEGIYAKDKLEKLMYIEGSWCLGFYPQVVDIDGDGIEDIASGSYCGKIYYYKKMADGFDVRTEVKQVTDVRARDAFDEVMFTNPTFADFNGDGLLDALVGGSKGFRVMINQGTKSEPLLGERTPILDVDGYQVVAWDLTEEQVAELQQRKKSLAGYDFKLFAKLIDWDGDQIPDLITTNGYLYKEAPVIAFHKGVRNENGDLRFKKAIPLLVAEDGGKALPGTVLKLHVSDLNNDGVLDVMLGASIVTNTETGEIDRQTADEFEIYKKNVNPDAKMKSLGYMIVMYGVKPQTPVNKK